MTSFATHVYCPLAWFACCRLSAVPCLTTARPPESPVVVCVLAHCRKRGYILLRPILFSDRHIHYLISVRQSGVPDSVEASSSSSSSYLTYTCWKVPRNLSSKKWPQLAEQHLGDLSGGHLVLSTDPAADPVPSVLEKFEEGRYTHVYRLPGAAGSDSKQLAAPSSSSSSSYGSREASWLFELQAVVGGPCWLVPGTQSAAGQLHTG
jgi:hypothetical protein